MYIILSLTLIFSMVSAAFAEPNDRAVAGMTTTRHTEEIPNGNLFALQSRTKTVVILTDDKACLIDISIKYPNQPDTVYQWRLSDYPVKSFAPNDDRFWDGIIAYAESNMAAAEIVIFEDITYDEPIDITESRSSASADLQADLVSLLSKFTWNKVFRNKKI